MTIATEDADPVRLRHRDLERIANAALRLGRTMMESGADVGAVHRGMTLIAEGLGAAVTGLRSGYASLALTVADGDTTITRMIQVGRLGVDQRRDLALRELAVRTSAEGGDAPAVHTAIGAIVRDTPRHHSAVVAIATGLACAAFGRLLAVDWPAFVPVLIGGAIGQDVRRRLHHADVNPFVIGAIVALVAALIGGIGARLSGSATVSMAMTASILLLVPGVPATNAQTDIMAGYPTVGSARAVWVIMMMVFASTGIWVAEALLGVRT